MTGYRKTLVNDLQDLTDEFTHEDAQLGADLQELLETRLTNRQMYLLLEVLDRVADLYKGNS